MKVSATNFSFRNLYFIKAGIQLGQIEKKKSKNVIIYDGWQFFSFQYPPNLIKFPKKKWGNWKFCGLIRKDFFLKFKRRGRPNLKFDNLTEKLSFKVKNLMKLLDKLLPILHQFHANLYQESKKRQENEEKLASERYITDSGNRTWSW